MDQKDLTDAEALEKTKQLRDKIVKGEDFAAVAGVDGLVFDAEIGAQLA